MLRLYKDETIHHDELRNLGLWLGWRFQPFFFAGQVFDLLTLTYPLADLVNVYMLCPEIPGNPINQSKLVNKQRESNMTDAVIVVSEFLLE